MPKSSKIIISCGEFGYGFSIRKPDYTSELLYIWDVYPGGSAYISGINPGDMVKSINEAEISGLTELQSLQIIETSKKNLQPISLEIIRHRPPGEIKDPPVNGKNVGSIAKLAMKGGVSLEELTKTKACPPCTTNKSSFKLGSRSRANRKTVPAGSVSTYSQSNLLNCSNCDLGSEKNNTYESMTELSGPMQLTRVGGLLDYTTSEKESHRNSTTSAEIWMHRIHHNIVPQPYKSPKDKSRNNLNYNMTMSSSGSQDNYSPQNLDVDTTKSPPSPRKRNPAQGQVTSSPVSANPETQPPGDDSDSRVPPTKPSSHEMLHRTSSNISLVELKKLEGTEVSKKHISCTKWHQVLLKRMPREFSHNWENYQIRIIEKSIELRPDTEPFDYEHSDELAGFIRLPIKGTHIQWSQASVWSPKTLFTSYHHQGFCECQLFRSFSNNPVDGKSSKIDDEAYVIINRGSDFRSLKLRFSNEEHAEAVLKPFIVISSKKRKRHRFGAGYFDSVMTDSILKNLPGARSSSLGLAGPPGAAPLCIAAETLGFSFGLSISKNVQPHKSNPEKSKQTTTKNDNFENCCSRNRIQSVFSMMKKTNAPSPTSVQPTPNVNSSIDQSQDFIENDKSSSASTQHYTSGEDGQTPKSPRGKRKSFKSKSEYKSSENSKQSKNTQGSSVKSILTGRLSIDKSKDVKTPKTDQSGKHSILDSNSIRKSSIFLSFVEKKDNLISSARQAKKSLIQENEVSESQIETTNELYTFDEGIGVASLVAVPVNVASAAIPVQNSPALVSVASATNSSPKFGDEANSNSLNEAFKMDLSYNPSKVMTPIFPHGKVHLHEIARSTVSPFVPFLVEMCVTIVEQFGLNCVGIYRMSGSKVAHDFIISELSKNIQEIDIKSEKWNDVYSMSCVLKTFIRNLPDSLFPRRMYSEFLSACRIEDREKRLLSIQRLLGIMECYPNHPEFRVHRATLRYLVSHLGRVSNKQSNNKMTPYNLALIFAPNLLQPVEETPEIIMQDSKFKIWLVETLIRYHDWIFSPDLGLESGCSIPPDLDEIPIPQVTDEETSMPFSTEVSRAEIEVRPVITDLLHAAMLLPPPLTDLESAEEPGPETDRPADLEAVRLQLKAESSMTHE